MEWILVTVLPNIADGVFWGFTSIKDVEEYVEELKENSNIQLKYFGDNVVVEIVPDYLIKATASVGQELLAQKDLAKMNEMSAKAFVELEKFLVSKGKKGFSGMIGIYHTDDTTSISYEGISYPAFRLPLTEALQLCNEYKYMVKINGQWVEPQQAMLSGQTLFDSLIVSPTKTGIFMEICSTATPEELKQE